jgi:carboxylesterase type B
MAELTIYQPINPEILPRLDPEYVAFHNSHLRYIIPQDSQPWDASIRGNYKENPFSGTSVRGVKVGNVHDIILKHAQLRVFTPEGESPISGWPVFIWFHGGMSQPARINA